MNHDYAGRENPVPCHVIGCRRETWRDDALCPRHGVLADREVDEASSPDVTTSAPAQTGLRPSSGAAETRVVMRVHRFPAGWRVSREVDGDRDYSERVWPTESAARAYSALARARMAVRALFDGATVIRDNRTGEHRQNHPIADLDAGVGAT